MPTKSASLKQFRNVLHAMACRRLVLWLLLAAGCGRSPPDEPGTDSSVKVGGATFDGGASGQAGNGNAGGTEGPGGSGGVTGSGGLIGTGSTQGSGSGGLVGSGGVTRTGGVASTGGEVGRGGAVGTGGTASSAAIGGAGGTTGSSAVFGMPCTTDDDCPSGAICCDGSNESCDDTRVPSGDGTNSGEFVVSSDGLTVTDTITGLVWQRDGSGTRPGCSGTSLPLVDSVLTCTWSEAQAYCAGLTLGGLSGWRLPAVMELSTIVDFTRFSPSIDPTAFPNTPAWFFWASSPHADPLGRAVSWIGFGAGDWGYTIQLGGLFNTRCVLGSRCYPTSRFMVLTGGLVQDTLTGLVWQQDGSGTRAGCSGSGNLTCTWAEAQAYCTGLGSGFRLPTVKELLSLVDDTVASGPTINQTAFPNTPTDYFWTSSPYDGSSGGDISSSGNAWFVDFSFGYSDENDVGGSSRVRCVR